MGCTTKAPPGDSNYEVETTNSSVLFFIILFFGIHYNLDYSIIAKN